MLVYRETYVERAMLFRDTDVDGIKIAPARIWKSAPVVACFLTVPRTLLPVTVQRTRRGRFLSPKPSIPYSEQVITLQEHGIGLGMYSQEDAEELLSCVNYYRLRGYWLSFERDGALRPGVELDDVVQVMRFDDALRTILFGAIAPVEILFRTSFAYELSRAYDPDLSKCTDAFANKAWFRNSLREVDRAVERSRRNRAPCTVHNLQKYGSLPLWALVEILSLGTVSKLYGNLADEGVGKAIAGHFGVRRTYLKSWVESLTYARNICAHHSRVYNRVMTKRPKLYLDMRPYDSKKQFTTLLILKHLHEKHLAGQWEATIDELCHLVERYPDVDLSYMGFPNDWELVLRLGGGDE